jgi:molybdenum cofactor guanylyltransferase
MTKRAAIILAGGKAKRFQTAQNLWLDKALAELHGKPLLIHAIENIQEIVDEIIVIVDENETRISKYQNVLKKHSLKKAKIRTDLKIKNQSGPLIAILTGLKFTNADYCITIPCDMPMLKKDVAEYMFNQINGSFIAVPMWANGRLETLLMILERKTCLEIATALSQLGRTHPDDIIRGIQKALFVSPLGKIKSLDPELLSFVNINSPDDLKRMQPRQGRGEFAENVRLNLGILPKREIQNLVEASLKLESNDSSEASEIFSNSAVELQNKDLFFWAAISWENQAKSLLGLLGQDNNCELSNEAEAAFLKAAQNYGSEAEVYLYNRCFLLAERAKADKRWCESQVEKLAVK